MSLGVRGLLRSRAVGAAVAQVWQAVGNFGLQIVAAWTLGAAGLGVISLSLGVIILATALASGLVGDSLVILRREDPRIRGALQGWAVVVAAVSAVGIGVAMALSLLTPVQAALFAGALVAFQVEELLRRVLMGVMAFWRLVVVDSVAVVGALGSLLVASMVGPVTIEAFFVALLIGQVAAIVTAVALLPEDERWLAPIRGADFRAVWAFGSWRGAQVAVPQLMLTASRVLITAFAGAAALGLVEGARILVAPVLLTVQGLGSYLLSTYVRDKALGVAELRSRAWRASGAMVLTSLLVGAVIVALAAPLGRLIGGSAFAVDPFTVAGWVAYAAASASLQPFASLAAVKGAPRRVFVCRVVDAAFAATLLVCVLALGLPAAAAPFVLAAGLVLGGVLVRAAVLAPLIKESPAARATELRIGHA